MTYSAVSYTVVAMRDPHEGLVFGDKYRIDKRIGKGAMAVVYKATQLPIERVVALKVLNRSSSNDPFAVKRFYREAKTLSALKHRNILNILDVGETETSQPYFVMEYLDGITLEQLIEKRGAVPISRAVPIFCQICEGMFYAHGKGIIHRDLKPGNIMLVNQDKSDELVKLVDFGIVKIKNRAQLLASQKLTQKGEIWGSPVYMSPEQCMGKELDPRSDVYSLGLLMYESLLAVTPVQAENIGSIVRKQLSEMPQDFKTAAPLLRIPEALEQIIFKAIQKNPESRHANMDELRAELENFGRKHGLRIRSSGASKIDLNTKLSEAQATAISPETSEASSKPEPAPSPRAIRAAFNESSAAESTQKTAGLNHLHIKLMIGLALAGLAILALLLAAKFLAGSVSKTNNDVIPAPARQEKKPDLKEPAAVRKIQDSKISKVSAEGKSNNSEVQKSVLSSKQEKIKESKAKPDINEAQPAKLYAKTSNPERKSQAKTFEQKQTITKTKTAVSNTRKKTADTVDESFLERIHLRRHQSDSTQKWLDIQEKE